MDIFSSFQLNFFNTALFLALRDVQKMDYANARMENNHLPPINCLQR